MSNGVEFFFFCIQVFGSVWQNESVLLSHICVGCVCVRRGRPREGETEVRHFQDGRGDFFVEGRVPSGISFSDIFFGCEYSWHDEGMHVYEVKSCVRGFYPKRDGTGPFQSEKVNRRNQVS